MTYENCKNSVKLSQVLLILCIFLNFWFPGELPLCMDLTPVTPSNAFCIIYTLYFPPLPTAYIINVTNSLYILF